MITATWIVFGIAAIGIIISGLKRRQRRKITRLGGDRIPPRPFMRPDRESGRTYAENRLDSILEKHHGDAPEFVRKWED